MPLPCCLCHCHRAQPPSVQILALFAMECPVSLGAEDIRNEKVKLLRSMQKINLDDVVVGQYRGVSLPNGRGHLPGALLSPLLWFLPPSLRHARSLLELVLDPSLRRAHSLLELFLDARCVVFKWCAVQATWMTRRCQRGPRRRRLRQLRASSTTRAGTASRSCSRLARRCRSAVLRSVCRRAPRHLPSVSRPWQCCRYQDGRRLCAVPACARQRLH